MTTVSDAVHSFRLSGGRIWLDDDQSIKVFLGTDDAYGEMVAAIQADRSAVVEFLLSTCSSCGKKAATLFEDATDSQARYCRRCLADVAQTRYPDTDSLGRSCGSGRYPPCTECQGALEKFGEGRLYCSQCCMAWAPSHQQHHVRPIVLNNTLKPKGTQ